MIEKTESTQSPLMHETLAMANAVASRDTTILVGGETGTGKSYLARLIHQTSIRRRKPLISLNCAGLSQDLTESELFGHERGAFTGAMEKKIGLFEAAVGGTLFLDEIGEMPKTVQAKLLRVLEEKKIRPVGGVREINVDVRLIAATNRDLEKEVEAGRFREDLYYRLNIFTLEVPPLRLRKEDIGDLARKFLREFDGESPPPVLSSAAEEILLQYHWPGNIRQLRNVMERAAILAVSNGAILPMHLSRLIHTEKKKSGRQIPAFGNPGMSLEELERLHIQRVFHSHGGNVLSTARCLGISRATLYRKLKKYRMEPTFVSDAMLEEVTK